VYPAIYINREPRPEGLIGRTRTSCTERLENLLFRTAIGIDTAPEWIFKPAQAIYSLYDYLRH